MSEYDAKRAGNTYAHLTNYSVAKCAADFESTKDETMWDTHERLRAYLRYRMCSLTIECVLL